MRTSKALARTRIVRTSLTGFALATATVIAVACGSDTTSPLTSTGSANSIRNFGATASARAVSLTAVKAQKADSFVNSIGVNTHLSYIGTSTIYGSYTSVIKPALKALGVKHVRDGMIVMNMNSWMDTVYINRWNDLHNSLGITFDAETNPAQGQNFYSTPPIVRFLQFANAADIESFEGLNEIDDQKTDTTWPSEDRAWQIALWTTVRATPAVANVPIIAPSLTSRGAATELAALGSLAPYANYGNMHPYPGDTIPSAWLARDSMWFAPVNGTLPVTPTETGYPTDSNTSYWVSQAAEGKYTPRLFLEFWNFGYPRTFDYQLADDQNQGNGINGWGLIDSTGAQKPAFKSLQYMISVLSDNGSQSFTPGTLSYSIGTVPSTVHHAVFQKSNGHYFLVLWNEVSSFNFHTWTDINNPTVNTTLTLSATPKQITYWRTDIQTETQAAALTSSRPIQIPDYPMIIELAF